MLGVDPDIGNSALRLWIAAGSAALLVFVCALAFNQTRTKFMAGSLARVGVVMVGAALGATLAWAFLIGASVRDQGAERRALELRATELDARALAPGSVLACLDGLAGDSVETACEKALFATPANVASATSFVAARLRLLADTVAYSERGGAPIDSVLLPLRRSLESDRFGFVAHTLAVRDDCRGESCRALSLLHDPSRVRANLSGQVLDHYLEHYAAVWAQGPDVPIADAAAAAPSAAAPAPRKVMVDIDFPTAASIPAVSIMNPEPKGPVVPGTAAAAAVAGADSSAQATAAAPTAPGPSKRQRKQTNNAAPPVVTAQQPPADPVWSPGATLAAPRPAATPAGGGPVQLSPLSTVPEASAGAPARPQ